MQVDLHNGCKTMVVLLLFSLLWGEGISVLVASRFIWSITQSSNPNQRTSDATC